MRKPVAPADQTWLLMDRPNNLMYVHSLMWLAEQPDWDKVTQMLKERVADRFPVFRRRAVKVDGEWWWEDVPDFDVQAQIRRVTLPEPGGRTQASEYVSARMSQPLDFDKPLWEMDFIDGAAGFDGMGEGAILFARFHHGLADGVRLVQVLLSVLDPMSDKSIPKAVGRSRGRRSSPAGQAVGVARSTMSNTADFVRGAGSAVAHAPRHISQVHPRTLARAAERLRQPTWIVEQVSTLASEENALVNTMRSVGRLTLSGRSVDTVWSGTVGVEKKITWIAGLPLREVRRAGREHGVSINDVLLSGVSLGVTNYLADKGVTDVDQVSWLIPISLKPIEAELPEELGNHFAVVNLPMVLGVRESRALLREMHGRMNRIKNSAEPVLIYGVQRMIAETPAAVSVRLTNFVANKSAGIITNVPGPRGPMGLAGTEVTAVLGFVPMSGDQPMGLCIFSYNGAVNIGIATDAALVPDPELLAEHIEKAVHDLIGESDS
jgi:diacylglycerol O-acyltransferase